MSWDDVADLAGAATRDEFGRAVSYVPEGDGDAVDLTGRFVERPKLIPGEPVIQSLAPRMTFTRADLIAAGVDPDTGDVLTFSVRDEERTYRVVGVETGTHGVTVLLGERSP